MFATDLRRRASTVGPWLVALLLTAAAFDIAYQRSRDLESVLADNLLSYNELLAWHQLGDPLSSFTLTPSPYFIDLAVQYPLALLSSDFERFAYWLGLTYASAVAASFIALFRAMGVSRWTATLSAGATMTLYFLFLPNQLVLNLYVPNHTSEVIGALLGIALVVKVTRTTAAPRTWELALYSALVFANIVSSPFFAATFVLPVLGALAVLAFDRTRARTALKLIALSVFATALGTWLQSLIAARWWMVRRDTYWQTALQSGTQLKDVLIHPFYWVAGAALALGVALAIVALLRFRDQRAPLTFFLLTPVFCAGLPVLRGAFDQPYSLRFLQLPALMSVALAVGAIVLGILHAAKKRPAIVTAVCGGIAVAALAMLTRFRGPLSESNVHSLTAPMLSCMRSSEHLPLLEDGLASVLPARFLNASFRGRSHALPNVVVQLQSWHPPSLHAGENNTAWFRDGYRKGKRSLNFLVTFDLDPASLRWLRQRVGEPDVIFRCPLPMDRRPIDRNEDQLETWVWTSEAAKRTLSEMVLRDNMRGLFVSLDDREATIDPKWGMISHGDAAELVGDTWTWQRKEGVTPAGPIVHTRPMFAPAGRYRADVDLSVSRSPDGVERPGEGATLAAIVGSEVVARQPVAMGAKSASFEYVSRNPGGPTSGDNTWFAVHAGAADRIEVRGIRLTRLEATGADPFRLLR